MPFGVDTQREKYTKKRVTLINLRLTYFYIQSTVKYTIHHHHVIPMPMLAIPMSTVFLQRVQKRF